MNLKELHESWVKTGYPSRTEIRKAIEALLVAEESKPHAPAINGLGITCCPECGTAIEACKNCPPYPADNKGKDDKGLVEECPCDHCPTSTSCNRMKGPCSLYCEWEAKFKEK